MKTNAHQNSIDAYHSDKMDSRTVKEMIKDYSLKHNHFTTQMCARAIGKVPSTLSRWIRELEEEGELVQELTKNICKITGNNAMYFYNPNYTRQIRLM